MRHNTLKQMVAVGMAVGVLSAPAGLAQTLQPDESGSQDVFTYQFGSAGPFGITTPPRQTNMDTQSLAAGPNAGSPMGVFLATSQSDPTTPGDPTTGHSANTWIKFDLSGVTTPVDAVDFEASLHLWVLDGVAVVTGALGAPAFGNPTVTESVQVNVYESGQAWDEQTITWENEVAKGDLIGNQQLAGVEQWLTVDVTDTVRSWLDGSEDNHGFVLEQDAVVASQDGVTSVVAALYASSAWDTASQRPFLQVVPEPGVASILVAGAAMLMTRRTAVR